MSNTSTHLALFNHIDPASEGIEKLREIGIKDENMTIISGMPYLASMLGRPHSKTKIPQIAMAGALVGAAISLFLNLGTPLLYPITVGGMPLLSIPPTILLTFELSMLGLMLSTLLGVIWESVFPSFGPKIYHPEVSSGKIAIAYACSEKICTQAQESLMALGAESVQKTEAKSLWNDKGTDKTEAKCL